jgi:hypothetical protein
MSQPILRAGRHAHASLLAFALGCLMPACKQERRPVPENAASGEPAKTAAPEPEPAVTARAYPPGVTPPPEPEKPPGAETKTGVCAFRETGYDGQDTKFAESLVVKLKSGRIVTAKYSYKGGYASEGVDETLGVPVKENEWSTFSVKVSSGSLEFKVRITQDRFKIKGTAVQDAEGNCTWIPEGESSPDAGGKR